MCKKNIFISIINKLCVLKVRADGPGGRTDGPGGRTDGPGGRTDRAEGPGGRTGRMEGPDGRKDPPTPPPPTPPTPHPPKIMKILFSLEHGKDAHRDSAKVALNDSSRSLIWSFLEQIVFLKIGENLCFQSIYISIINKLCVLKVFILAS